MKAEIIELSLDLIDEDPNQPRKSFDEASLKELSASIAERGVKSPISVHIGENGRYIINHGARRYRASKLAGKTTIPAFVDEDYNLIDQVIENIQRDELTVREIIDVIATLMKNGMKISDLAERFHKSKPWVCERMALTEAPEPVFDLIKTNRVTDVSVLAQLGRLYNKAPDIVTDYIENTDDIKRKDVFNVLTAYIDEQNNSASNANDTVSYDDYKSAIPAKSTKEKDSSKLKLMHVRVLYHGSAYELRLRKPTVQSKAWIRDEQGQDREVPIDELELMEVYQQ